MFQVTLFQLEKMFGKGKDAKEFIDELCKGHLAQFICERSPCCIFMSPQKKPSTLLRPPLDIQDRPEHLTLRHLVDERLVCHSSITRLFLTVGRHRINPKRAYSKS